MKIQIVKNRYFNALLLLMLFSAFVHMVILFIVAIFSLNLHVLNYFAIVDANYIIPSFFNSSQGDAISFIVVVLLYGGILYLNRPDNV
jgi:uncharacterized membrane protein